MTHVGYFMNVETLTLAAANLDSLRMDDSLVYNRRTKQ